MQAQRGHSSLLIIDASDRRDFMTLVLIAVILLTFGHYSADAAMLPNAAADSLAQCHYSAARLIENPSEEASVFPQDVPACGSLDAGANDETKEVAVVVDASVNVSAAISQFVLGREGSRRLQPVAYLIALGCA
jgi:hypothetical protein